MAKNILLTLSFLLVLTNINNLPLNNTCQNKDVTSACILFESCPPAVKLAQMGELNKLREMVCERTPNKKVCCPIEMGSITFINESSEKAVIPYEPKRKKIPTLATKEITTELEDPSTILHTMTTEPTEAITEKLLQTTLKLPSDPFPDRNVCGRMGTSSRIVGGDLTDLEEFPWLARIGYRQRNGKVTFNCAASLITDQYLITAAHCLLFGEPIGVRLGEWDEQTSIDCNKDHCINKPVDRKILESKIFPQYNVSDKTYGDIGLIKLEKPVKFTDTVQPICLPTTDYVKMQDYVDGNSYWTAGWGITEYDTVSSIKRKVLLDAVSNEVCQAIYPEVSKSSLSQIICAGGSLGKDTCRGDSGGPLMRAVKENYKENWYIYGIISLGHNKCGGEGQPGFYTRVTKYMDWIRKTIENN